MKELEGLEDNGSTEEENERPQRENRRENNRGKYRREQTMRHRRRMSEAKAVRIVRKTIAARNASIVTAVTIAAESANTETGMTTVRNASTGNAAITVAETIIVTAERMPTVKIVAREEKNANTAESGISGGIETTTERIIRVETTNVENKTG